MIKILINNTDAPIPLDIGKVIPTLEYTIDPIDYGQFARSNSLVTYVGNGDITVNDGTVNLDYMTGVALILGSSSPTKTTVSGSNGNDFIDEIGVMWVRVEGMNELIDINKKMILHLSKLTNLDM